MKKIVFTLILAAGITGCTGALDRFTEGSMVAETTFQSVDDLQKGLNTVYGSIGVSSEYELNSTFTDECGIGYANGGQGLNDNYAFFMNPTSADPEGIWSTYYGVINAANRVLQGATYITPSADELTAYNTVVGQTYALRAYAYLQLLSYFSTDLKDMNAPAVMLSVTVPKINEQLGRATTGKIYDLIFSDLNNAESLLPGDNNDVYYVDTNFVNAVRARAYLYKGDYTNALASANTTIASSIALSSSSDYRNMFHLDQAGTESIFKLKRVFGSSGIGGVWASLNATVSGSPFFEIGRSLFNDMLTTLRSDTTTFTVASVANKRDITTTAPHGLVVNDMIVPNVSKGGLKAGTPYFVFSVTSPTQFTVSTMYDGSQISTLTNGTNLNTGASPLTVKANYGDIRYSTTVAVSSIIDPNYSNSSDFRNTDKLIIGKYPGTTANGALNNDIKVIRMSEIYLIKAEAQAGLNDLSGAANTLKTLRDARRNRPSALESFSSTTDAYKAILQERKIELAFEGFRFLDIKRLGVATGTNIVRDPMDCMNNSNACSIQAGDHRFALPIPLSEANGNSVIRGQQNPGY